VGTASVTSTNFNVSSAGVVTLAGAQTSDITTAAAATSTALTVKPGTSSGASSNGPATTISGGDGSGTTTVVGGALSLTGGNATGASGTRTGGAVTVQGGTAGTTGTGGALLLQSGAGGSSSGGSGTVTLSSGSVSSGNTGNTTVQTANTSSGNFSGILTLQTGTAINTTSGAIFLQTGTSGSSNTGAIQIATGLAGSAGTAGAITIQSGSSGLATGTGAAVTIQAGNQSGATASTGGLLTLQGGNATGGSQTGGGVTIDSGTGTTGGAVNVGTTSASAVTLGRSGATGLISIQGGSGGVTANATAGNLTLSTTTSGILAVTSAGALNLTGAAASTLSVGANTLAITSSSLTVSTAGVVTLAGAQASDITTAASGAGTATAITVQPGNSGLATGTGAALTVQAGNQSGATASIGGLLTLKGGNATGGTQIGGGVTINGGSGTTNGSINVGTATTAGITLGAVTVLSTPGAATNNSLLCRNSSNQIATCTSAGVAFLQNANTFGAIGVLGTTDAFGLNVVTGGVKRALFDNSTNLYLGNADTAGGTTASAPTAFTVQGTGAATATNSGGAVTLQGGTGNTSGNGGALTLNGGTPGVTGAGGAVSITSGAGGATSGSSGAVTIASGNATAGSTAGNVSIDNGSSNTGTPTLNIGTTNAKSIGLGNTTNTTTLAVHVANAGTLSLGDDAVAAATVNIGGVTNSAADAVNIATNATLADTVTIGSTNAASSVLLQGGAYTAKVTNTGIGVNTGANAPTADLTFGDAANRTINVLTRTTAGAGYNLTISGGTGNTANNVGGNLVLQGGGGVGTGASGSVIVKPQVNNLATAFQVQNVAGTSVALNVDTTNLRVGIGNNAAPASTLDVKDNSASVTIPTVTVQQAGAGDTTLEVKSSLGSYFFGQDASNTGALSIGSTTAATTSNINFVQGSSTLNDTTATTITQAFGSNVTSGNTIVVSVGWQHATATLTCTDTQGNTYATAVTKKDAANNNVSVCYAVAGTTGANTVTATFSVTSPFRRINVSEYTGIRTVSPLDGTASASGTAATTTDGVSSGAITTTQSGDMIYGTTVDTNGTQTIGAGTGYAQLPNWDNILLTQIKNQVKAGSVASTATFPAAHTYIAVVVAFKPTVAALSDNYSNALFQLSQNGVATFKNSTNSTSAFQVQNAAGTSAINVDTYNNFVGIGTNTPTQTLDVIGGIRATGNLNVQQFMNFYGPFGIINVGTSGAALVFQVNHASMSFKDGSTGHVHLLISPDGATTFQNNVDSTTAFQIQNSAGTSNLFNADTQNTRIGIGTAAPGNKLSVNAVTTADASAVTAIGTGATTNKGLVVQGVASQTGDLLNLQDSTGAELQTFDANGNQETTGYYNNGVGGIGQFANLLTYSEQFDNAAWTKTSVTAPTANTILAPDGQTSAESLADSGSGGSVAQTSATAPTNANYTFSVWLKTASGTQAVDLRIDGATTGTGTKTTVTATTTWQRFSVTQNPNGFTGNIKTLIFPGGTAGTGTIHAWGAQLVLASTPLVYSRATATSITASAGVVSNGGVFVSSINATDKPLIIQGAPSQSGDLLQIQNSAGTLLSGFSSVGNLGVGVTPSATVALSVVGVINTTGIAGTATISVDNAATSTTNYVDLKVAGTRRATLATDTSGNVALQGTGTGATYLAYNGGTGGVVFGNGAGASVGSVTSAGAATFNGNIATSGSTGVTLYASTGDIAGTGTLTLGSILNHGTIKHSGAGGNLHLDSTSSTYIDWFSGGGLTVGNGASTFGPVAASAFNVNSSIRFKTNIRNTHYSLSDLLKLQPVEYNYIPGQGDPTKNQSGFIAEDVALIYPEAVAYDAQGLPSAIDYAKFAPLIVQGVKDQQVLIQTNASQIAAIQNQLGSVGNSTDINISGTAKVANLEVTGNATLDGDLSVAGSGSISGTLAVAGQVTAGSLAVTADATIGGTLKVTGNAEFAGDIKLTGQVNTRNAITKKFKASEAITEGSVVVLDPAIDGSVKQTTTAADSKIVGVAVTASTNPGDDIEVAIGGSVQVRIPSTETITAGDIIGSATSAGMAKLLANPVAGSILGKATSKKDVNNMAWLLITLQ
jgi:hypothetical protein